MPRPRKCRMVGFIPDNPCFHPQVVSCEEVILSIEEVEAIRLSDYLEMEQGSASESMNVSRGTFQRIINVARKKIADALLNGKTIRINGGNYELPSSRTFCLKRGISCKPEGREKCKDCAENNQNK